MSVNKYEVQKMYDAGKNITREVVAKVDPTLLFGGGNDGSDNFIFKNEYERRMFLVGLKTNQIEEAIIAVERDTVGLSASEKPEYLEVLKKMKAEISVIRMTAHKELEETKFVINALIPNIEDEKNEVKKGSSDTEKENIIQLSPQENTETIDPFTKIAETLRSGDSITKQVRDNSDRIQTLITSALNQYEAKKLTNILVDSTKTNKDFQIALGVSEDGIIGPITINAFFEKVGIIKEHWLQVPQKTRIARQFKKTDALGVRQPIQTNGGDFHNEMKQDEMDISQKIHTSAYFKDGAYYLIGPKGRPTRVEFQSIVQSLDISKNAPENLQKSVEIINDFSEVLDAYLIKYPDKKNDYESALVAVKGAFKQTNIQNGKQVVDISMGIGMLKFDSIFDKSIEKKFFTIFKNEDSKSRHLKVLEFIREDLDQSDIVVKSIMSRNAKEFGIIDEDIIKGNISKAQLTPEQEAKVQKIIDEAKIEAAKNWSAHKTEYIETFKKEYPGVIIDEAQAEESNKNITILAMAKREIFYQKLYNTSFANQELNLLKDILGAGTWDMSDKSKDMSGEAAKIIGIEALALAAGIFTAGVGTIAVNTAATARNVARGGKFIEAYGAAKKAQGLGRTASRILGSGAGFELGHANMVSLIENGEGTFGTKEGYAQSIAMMGVLSGIGHLIQAGKFGTSIQFKEGAGFGKNVIPFVGQTVIEGSAIFGTTGVVGQVLVDGRDNWTPEQLAQAMIMATIFKGVTGSIRATKKPNGEIEVKPIIKENIKPVEDNVISLRSSSQKNKYINGAQPGDTVDLKDMGILKKLPDGRWSLTNGSEVKYFENNETLISDIIAGTGKGSKNFFVKPTIEKKGESVVTRSEAVSDGRVQEILAQQSIKVDTPQAVKETQGLIRKLSDNKAAKIAWDMTTKEMKSGGFWKTAISFPTNLMRLPAINARKIGELWVEKTEKGFGLTKETEGKNRFLESFKIAATSSEKPFEGKTQSMASILAIGTVAYLTYKEILEANPSTPVEVVWRATWGYLKNMNITLPYELGKVFFTKNINSSEQTSSPIIPLAPTPKESE